MANQIETIELDMDRDFPDPRQTNAFLQIKLNSLYPTCNFIFTDGSKTEVTVGIGLYIPNLNINYSAKLSYISSIYHAELVANLHPLQFIQIQIDIT